jgi:hypothetical protein
LPDVPPSSRKDTAREYGSIRERDAGNPAVYQQTHFPERSLAIGCSRWKAGKELVRNVVALGHAIRSMKDFAKKPLILTQNSSSPFPDA